MKRNLRHAMFLVILLSVAVLAGCGSSVSGTYIDVEGTGAFTLELKSGGAATLTFNGMPLMCTYSASGNNVSLSCPGQAGALTLTVQKDGTLTPPPGTFLPALKKK
jgi:hypothetical protein